MPSNDCVNYQSNPRSTHTERESTITYINTHTWFHECHSCRHFSFGGFVGINGMNRHVNQNACADSSVSSSSSFPSRVGVWIEVDPGVWPICQRGGDTGHSQNGNGDSSSINTNSSRNQYSRLAGQMLMSKCVDGFQLFSFCLLIRVGIIFVYAPNTAFASMPVQSNLVDYENLIQLNRRPQNWQYTHSHTHTQAGSRRPLLRHRSYRDRLFVSFRYLICVSECVRHWWMRLIFDIDENCVHHLRTGSSWIKYRNSICSRDFLNRFFAKLYHAKTDVDECEWLLCDKAFANLNRREHLPHICQIAEKLTFTLRLDSRAFTHSGRTNHTD